MRQIMSIFLVLAVALPVLPGCASKYGEQKTVVNYYPGCYEPIQDLRNRENQVGKTTAGGAVVGALGGALVGLLATGGDWRGAVVGAAAGGATGAVAGNIYARNQKVADDNIRLANYMNQLDGDISNLDIATAAAKTSLQCYNNQFNALLSAIREKRITRDVAVQRFGEITSGRQEAIAILGNVVNDGRQLEQQYEQAFAQEEKDMMTPQKMSQGQAVYQKKAKTLKTARTRARAISKATASASEVKQIAEQEQVSQTANINEVLEGLDNIRM